MIAGEIIHIDELRVITLVLRNSLKVYLNQLLVSIEGKAYDSNPELFLNGCIKRRIIALKLCDYYRRIALLDFTNHVKQTL